MTALVLDTNIVLDVFVFDDDAARPLREGLLAGRLRWLATAAMREELARVLAYPQIVPRLAFRGLSAAQVLDAFDRHATPVDAAPKAPVTCKDPDDQIFIDLAVRERALLLSKDSAVLSMRKRMEALGSGVHPRHPGEDGPSGRGVHSPSPSGPSFPRRRESSAPAFSEPRGSPGSR